MSILASKILGGQTRSTELNEFIRDAIRRGELKPGERLGTAKQLATHWQVSYGVVRQSLETLAADGVVERRQKAGTFVSATPDPTGGDSGRRNIIGLLVPDIRMPEHSLVARHLQDAGRKAHFEVLVSSTDNDRERYDQSVISHLRAGVGGVILIAPRHARISLETLLELEKSGLPVVNYARSVDSVSWPTVATDLFQVTYLPVQHLCQLGRRRIAMLSYALNNDDHGVRMLHGAYRAVADAGLSASNISDLQLPMDLYLKGWGNRQALGEFLGKWLDENPKIDAICCTHDHIAAALLSLLSDRGVRVPDDVAITGMGNMSEYFGFGAGDLTTVTTRVDKAAEEMVRILQLGKIATSQDQPLRIDIQPELILGRSTLGDAACTSEV